MKRYRVYEYGNYAGEKEIEAESKKEAIEKYMDDPCKEADYDYDNTEIEAELEGEV